MNYRKAQEAVQTSLVQWQASIARGESFAVRQAYAELYSLALGALARESLRSAKRPSFAVDNDSTQEG
jgi:hypothetical protein